ncbi:GON domain-containing protein [Melittangium boletus]|uniref:GON domain-containing protein n=1 Tax=Melittangium boletus TaxID=83453 RepID=UPI003DA33F0D
MKTPSRSVPSLRLALLGLASLTAACGGAEAPASAAREEAQTLGHALSPRPATCAEVRAATPDAPDGEYLLFASGDAMRPWAAWCHDMAGTPTEYLTLAQTGPDTNVSEYFAGGVSPGTSVRTAYTRLRINPHTLTVDTGDQRFATSTGQLTHSPDTVKAMPYATAMSCTGDYRLGTASIDLRGTGFMLLGGQFQPSGNAPDGSTQYGSQLQTATLRGGGYCGWNAPQGSYNPYNQNGALLRLRHDTLRTPASCAEVRQAFTDARDGTYVLYAGNLATQPWLAYCHDMKGTPQEYLPLVRTGPTSNVSEYVAGGASPGTTVRTAYTRLRLDPTTLTVDTGDQRFATSTGELTHSPDTVKAMPYAVAMACDSTSQATASIDLRGTAFEVLKGQLTPGGAGAFGGVQTLQEHQHLVLAGGGYCGWVARGGSYNPYNQSGLPLALNYRGF